MRIVVANCRVTYTGRGDTFLGDGRRAIIVKDDGCVSIHCDSSNKPLNYMGKDAVFVDEGNGVWVFDSRKESLRIEILELFSDEAFVLDSESTLERDGTENHLQGWLAENPQVFGEGFVFGEREFQTGNGPVDLLCYDAAGIPVVVEVKRTAMLGCVDQVRRYVEAARLMPGFEEVYGLIAAVDVRPKTIALAEKRGIDYVVVPSNWNNKTPAVDIVPDADN